MVPLLHEVQQTALVLRVPSTPCGRATTHSSGGAPKEQPPRNLSGPRTVRAGNAGEQTVASLGGLTEGGTCSSVAQVNMAGR